MSETKFTKGSWGIHVCDSTMEPMIANAENGKPAFAFCTRKIGVGKKVIADVHMRSSIDDYNLGYPCPDNMEEMLANTHLIAAAPELYEALRMAANDLNTAAWMMAPEINPALFETVQRAEAALTKARGEA